MPPSGPPPAGRTVTAAEAPLGLGYTASDTARRRGSPTSWLSSPAVASSTCGRPASRSTTVASGLFWSDTALVGSGPASVVNTPAATGSPADLVPAAQRDRPAGGDRDHRDGVAGRQRRVPVVVQHHHGPPVISEGIRQRDRGIAAELDLSREAGQPGTSADADHLPVEQRNVAVARRCRHGVAHVPEAARPGQMAAVRIREGEASGPGDQDDPAGRPDSRARRVVSRACGPR